MTPLIQWGGWGLSNLLSVSFGLALLASFWRFAHRDDISHPKLLFVALAFSPLVMVNAATTIEFIPAMALLWWAFHSAQQHRWYTAAILVGVACGLRPSSGLFLLPLGLLAYQRGRRPAQLLRTLLLALGVAVVCYSPVLLAYGRVLGAFSAIALGFQERVLNGGYRLLQLLGVVQTLIVFGLVVVSAWSGRRRLRELGGNPQVTFHLVNIVAWTGVFFILPSESEYLLPMLPSLLWFADQLLSRRSFVIAVLVLLSFHLVQVDPIGGESGRRTVSLSLREGFTVRDIQDRRFKLALRETADVHRPEVPTVLMYGAAIVPAANSRWVYDAEVGAYRQRDGTLYVADRILDETRLTALRKRGLRLVVWKGEMWEYYYSGRTDLLTHVEVVDSLDDFFGRKLSGRPFNR